MWELHRLDQKTIQGETSRLEKAEREAAGEAPIPPSMVIRVFVALVYSSPTAYCIFVLRAVLTRHAAVSARLFQFFVFPKIGPEIGKSRKIMRKKIGKSELNMDEGNSVQAWIWALNGPSRAFYRR